MCIDDDSKRRRRRLLTATGAATAVALSGCLDQWRRVKEASEDEESTAEDRDDGDDGDDDTETTSESTTPTGETLEVAMLLPGSIDDGGFMEAGYDGLQAIEAELGAETTYTEGGPGRDGAADGSARKVSGRRPRSDHRSRGAERRGRGCRGTGVLGDQVRSNPGRRHWGEPLELRGAPGTVDLPRRGRRWLLTESGVVGHISGIRVPPGLKGRAAYADGLEHTNPAAELLTTFAGDQDDPELARRVTEARIEAGPDPIFTMLNAGRQGAIEAARSHEDVALFGNVGEWYPEYPDVFVGSAIADVSIAALRAAHDVANGEFQSGTVVEIGLENPDAVRLSLAPPVPETVRKRTDALSRKIVGGDIEVETAYDGPEFEPAGASR